jgi:hypothetical protein
MTSILSSNSIYNLDGKKEVNYEEKFQGLDENDNVIIYLHDLKQTDTDEKDLEESIIKKNFIFREITKKQASSSKLINYMIMSCDNKKIIPIPSNSMSQTTFNNVIDYLILVDGKTEVRKSEPITNNYRAFWNNDTDVDFIQKFDKIELCNICKAANYLDFERLLFLSASSIANKIKTSPKVATILVEDEKEEEKE